MIAPEHQSRGLGAAVMRLLQDEARALGAPILIHVLKVVELRLPAQDRADGLAVIGDRDRAAARRLE